MGGVQGKLSGLDTLADMPACCFIVPGISDTVIRRANRLDLPQRSHFFHPDLVHAADVVIGKAGYSTIAEVYSAGVPFGFITRPDSREMGPLEAYIEKELSGRRIALPAFESGAWLDDLACLLALPIENRKRINGARQVADYILAQLQGR